MLPLQVKTPSVLWLGVVSEDTPLIYAAAEQMVSFDIWVH